MPSAPSLSPRFVPDDIFAVAEVPRTAQRQEAGAAHQEAAAGPAHREGGQQGRHGQPRLPGVVCGLCRAACGLRRFIKLSMKRPMGGRFSAFLLLFRETARLLATSVPGR